MILHAGLLAIRRRRYWSGVLIEGPSGAGKSDLALRMMGHDFCLVADDRVIAWTSDGRLWGRAPDALFGLIEMRGVGVRPAPALPFAPIDLIVRLSSPADIERTPEPERYSILGINLPVIRLAGFEDSAPAKVRNVLNALGEPR